MEIKRAWQSLMYMFHFKASRRAEYAKKHKIFGSVGENVRLPHMLIPLRAENIYFHNNIELASGVRLVPHDAIHIVFNLMQDNDHNYPEHIEKIEIMDNVFIGANAIILSPCKIGPNAIVAAGAVVCSDVPPGSIVGGPAKVIGSFEELRKKRY